MTNNSALCGEKVNETCFICDSLLKESGVYITDAHTAFLSVPFPDKLGNIIGNKFVVVVSENDKICKKCHILVNQLDEIEHNLTAAKQQIIDLLEKKYNLHFDIINKHGYYENAAVFKKGVCVNSGLSDNLNNNHPLPESKHSDVNSASFEFCKNDITDVYSNRTVDLLDFDVLNETNTGTYIDVILHKSSIVSDGASDNTSKKLENDGGPLCDEYEAGSRESDHKIKCSEEVTKFNNEVRDLQKDAQTHALSGDNALKKNANNETGEESMNIDAGEKKFIDASSKDGKHFLCKICEMSFPNLSLFTRHVKGHQVNSEKIKCSSCNLECHDLLHYLCHRKFVHDVLKYFSCALCDEDFSTNKELRNHLLFSHEGNKKFICPECGEEFKRHDRFQNHKLYSHGNQECRLCGKHIPNVVKLRQHEKRHARVDSSQYICDVCGRAFKTPGGLRVHKVSHTGNYKFFCEFCGRGFMSSVILEEHKGVHTKEDRYICDICGRKFVLYSTFHLHVQWHKDPFPFPCSLCDKKFKYRSMRSIHVRRDHTGDHPYKCGYCDAQFLKASNLKRHLILHTKEYPFNCDMCKKGFDQRRNLARHLSRVHNDKSLSSSPQQKCQYKVVLRPDEFGIQS